MKKTYLFALAAAGLLASCSSNDDFSGGDVDLNAEIPQAIQVNVSSATAGTRGTGTVGDTEASGANLWHGQKFYLSMFDKGTMDFAQEKKIVNNEQNGPLEDIYNNATFLAPGGDNHFTPDAAVEGQADEINHGLKYYPMTGNYDFVAYHTGNTTQSTDPFAAANFEGTAAVGNDREASDYQPASGYYFVNYKLDGANDLMVAKAPAVDEQSPLQGDNTQITADRHYSAFSARHGVQPKLEFEHQLARFSFHVIGSESAIGGNSALAEIQKYYKIIDTGKYTTNVLTEGIEVSSGDPATPIEYNYQTDTKEFVLSTDRDEATHKYEKAYAGAAVSVKNIALISKSEGKMIVASNDANNTLGKLIWTPANDVTEVKYTAQDPEVIAGLYKLDAVKTPANAEGAPCALLLKQRDADNPYTADQKPLTDAVLTSSVVYQQIGDALLVAPIVVEDNEPTAQYTGKLQISQNLYNYDGHEDGTQPEPKVNVMDFTLDAKNIQKEPTVQDPEYSQGSRSFEAGKTYYVYLIVRGLEQIDVFTTLTPWNKIGEIELGNDE